MDRGLPIKGSTGVRHRFHSICPYFAMFPEAFVEKHLSVTSHKGFVFDPFCGRGTTVFQALLQSRKAAGCDVNPVAACISGAKCDPPGLHDIRVRLTELQKAFTEPDDGDWGGALGEFFEHCFHPETLLQVRYLRCVLDHKHRKDDRFIAALCLGSLHGESHKSPNYFSNRMPRTISTKPEYSVQWWWREDCVAPRRNVFEILERMLAYRFQTHPPEKTGCVAEADARDATTAFPELKGCVTDVITSPPYLDTTNYHEDQWLRLWFLGGAPIVQYSGHDDRHTSKINYWKFLQECWEGIGPLLADQARLVVRIGSRRLGKAEIKNELLRSLLSGLGREVRLADPGVTSDIANTQANSFRGTKGTPFTEHDFCFAV